MSPLVKRTISGLILVIVVMEMTARSAFTFYTLWSIVGALCLIEYLRLVRRSDHWKGKVVPYAVGSLYIAGSIALLMTLNDMMVLTIITIVWINDTGAYIVGSSVGRHQMAPKISPKKSWEGFAGGLAFAVGLALVWWVLYWSYDALPQEKLFGAESLATPIATKLRWAAFGLVIALGSVVGDLVESKFKRIIGVKDSGSLIPGHGGMLDRFDAMLMAVPVAWLYLKLVELV